jgi:ATP-dependent DNA ligase
MTPPELCQLVGAWDGRNLPDGAVIETKHDGFRALYIRDWEGRPGLWTRGGIPIEGVGHILHELAAFERIAGEPLMIDGEFCVGDGPDTLATTKAWCEREWKFGGEAGTFYAFDCLSFEDWMRGGSSQPWWQRKQRLQALALAVETDAEHMWTWRPGSRGRDEGRQAVRVLPHREVWHVDEAIEMAGEMWAAGLEGCVVKDAFAPYVRARSNSWLKVGRPWRDRLGWRAAA